MIKRDPQITSLLPWTILAIIAFIPTFVLALPRFALLRAEVNCMSCHVNPTGGELRTEAGESYSIERLPMWKRGDKFSAQFTPNIRIGVDLRSQFLSFQDQSTIRDTTSAATNTSNFSTLQSMTLPVYLSAELTQSLLVYGKYDFINPNGGYEAFGLLHFVHSSGEIFTSTDAVGDAYVKLGVFMPAFGIHFDDHTIYTRGGDGSISQFGSDGLFFKPNYHDIGAEVGATFFDHVGITLGCFDGLEEKQVATFSSDTLNKMAFVARAVYATELVEDNVALEVGGSFYHHTKSTPSVTNPDSSFAISMVAVHGGLRLGPVSILAEADFAANLPFTFRSYHSKARALVAEGDVEITQGLTATLRYDSYHDEDADGNVGTEVTGRIGIGLQWFPIRFIEFRPEVRFATLTQIGTTNPTQRDEHKERTVLLQTHIFF